MITTVEPPFRSSRYTTGAILLHWTIALLILIQLVGGYAMTSLLDDGSELQFDVYQLHKSIGITVLVLTVARIVWRVFNPPPPEPSSVGRLERRVAHAVHATFYALLLIIPLSGWLMITVSPVQIETVLYFTDALPWPHLPGFEGLSRESREALTHWTELAHAWLAYGAGVLVALHVAGALKHHLADGRYIARMSPLAGGDGPRNSYGHATTFLATAVFFGALVGAAAVARNDTAPATVAERGVGDEAVVDGVSPDQAEALATAVEGRSADDTVAVNNPANPPFDGTEATGGEETAIARAPTDGAGASALDGTAAENHTPGRWVVDQDESAVTYTFGYQDATLAGAIEAFDAVILFDPDDLAASSIEVTLDLSSATVEGTQVTVNQLHGPDGFAVDDDPNARFVSERIVARGEDAYLAEGTLSLRDAEEAVALPFTLDVAGGVGTAEGSVGLDRLAYGIGQDNDPGADWITPTVDVTVRIVAQEPGGETEIAR